jgi:hypothetical protein
MADSSAWPSLIGTAIGGLLTLLGSLGAQYLTTRRERELRVADETRRRIQTQKDFQAQNLMRVQNGMVRLRDEVGSLVDRRQSIASREATQEPVPTALKENYVKHYRMARKILSSLTSFTDRVKDDELRDKLRAFIRAGSAYMREPTDPAEIAAARNQLDAAYGESSHRLGDILRELI